MAKGSRWESDGNGDRMIDEGAPVLDPEDTRCKLHLTDAYIEKNCLGHYYIVGFLPGGIRVAGWMHERPVHEAS